MDGTTTQPVPDSNAPSAAAQAAQAQTDPAPPAVNESARRIANLLFLFSTASAPVPTQRVISDSDLGYGSANPASDKRKFRRDREELSRRGYYIVQAQTGAAENEEGAWQLDRERSYAQLPQLPAAEFLALVRAIDSLLTDESLPYLSSLSSVRSKLATSMMGGIGDVLEATPAPHEADPAAAALWKLFQSRTTARFSYTNARNESSERSVDPYGFFELEGNLYMVGADRAKHASPLRTFNVKRISAVKAGASRYEIPPEFDVARYIFLPFELGDDDVDLTLFIPSTIASGEKSRLTLGKGELEEAQGGTIWHVHAADLDKAASFSLEAGICPLSPASLVERWQTLVSQAVSLHA